MYVEKVINNNIVSSKDEKGREIVVMGRGIGFQSKLGQRIDTQKVEKVFRMETDEESEQLKSVLADIQIFLFCICS